MNNPWQPQLLLSTVTHTLAQVLGIDSPDEIRPDEALVDGLNVDSLDLVEFRYNIEKQLGILLPKKSVLEHLAEKCRDDLIYRDGRLTEFSANVLQRSFFAYTPEQVYAGMYPQNVMALTSVRHWSNYCHTLFDYLPEHCPDCKSSEARLDAKGKVICSNCSASLKPPSGDVAFATFLTGLLEQPSNARDAAA